MYDFSKELTLMSILFMVKYFFTVMSSNDSTFVFSDLLKSFRVVSKFYTLSEFADALFEFGLQIDVSELSRWQTGKRVPKDRKTVLVVLKAFIQSGAINSSEQANQLIGSSGQGFLTDEEVCEMFPFNKSRKKIEDINRVEVLLNYYAEILEQGKRGNSIYYSVIEKEIEEIEWLMNKAYEFNFFLKILSIWHYLGVFLWDTGRWNLYHELAQLSLSSAMLLDDKRTVCKILLEDLVWVNYWQNNLDQANQHLHKGWGLLTDIVDVELEALYYLRSGYSQLCAYKSDQSIQDFGKALSMYQKNNNQPMKAKVLIGMGLAYLNMKQSLLAENSFRTVIELSKQYTIRDKGKAISCLGEVSMLRGLHQEAIHHFTEALKIGENEKKASVIAWTKLKLAGAHQGKLRRQFADEALIIFDRLAMPIQTKKAHRLLLE